LTCGAGNDAAASCVIVPSGADVWYSYTPSCNHALTVDTAGSNFDTVLTVYTGTCGALSEAACDDDGGPSHTSIIHTPVLAGVPYLIRAAGYNGASGQLHINLGPVAQTNDLCAGAATISGMTTTGANCGAGRELNISCNASGASGDVWYRWVPACSGLATLDTCGSAFDTVLSLHTGACGSLTEVACNDDQAAQAACPSQARVSFLRAQVTAGTQYSIRVSGFGPDTGPFALNIKLPANDDCQHAAPVGPGVTTGSTVCATPSGAAACVNTFNARDLWYSFSPACRGPAWVDLCASDYDTVVQVFTGQCGALTEVACNDDRGGAGPACTNTRSFAAFNATPGTPYTIRVAGFNLASGQVSMLLKCCPADVNLSGTVSVQDIFDFLAAYFSNDPRADFNASNTISVQDIFDYLAAYFAGCP
jgi:hypothetical protein